VPSNKRREKKQKAAQQRKNGDYLEVTGGKCTKEIRKKSRQKKSTQQDISN